MSLFPTVYRSTDPGAPALSGVSGSLVALLDAVLVDGYGSGANAKAGAGWSRVFSAGNVHAYRGNQVSGTGYCLRVDDSASIGNARYAWWRGYESMSDIDTGLNPVPTVAQIANGCMVPKSSTLDGTSRPWMIVATERCFYLFVDSNPSVTSGKFFCQFAGDLTSYKVGDMHHFALMAAPLTSWSGANTSLSGWWSTTLWQSAPAATAALYMGRSHAGGAGAVVGGFVSASGTPHYVGGPGGTAYPDPVSAGMQYESVLVNVAAGLPRGELPGIFAPLSAVSFAGDTILTDVAGLPGESLLVAIFSGGYLQPPNDNFRCTMFIRLSVEW